MNNYLQVKSHSRSDVFQSSQTCSEYAAKMCSYMEYPRSQPYESTRFTGIRAVKGRLRRQKQTSRLEINLDNHYTTRVYNSGSTISGDFTVNPKHDTPIDEVRIMLVGRCRVRQEDVSNTSLNYHTFLTLDMPISSPNGMFLSNISHRIPFRFVVPHGLLPTACSHPVECESAQSHHTRLPPTMGDWEKDDMAPDMARIKYEIVAQVNPHGAAAVEARKRVRILSSSQSLDTPKKSKTISKPKAIHKSAFSKASGHIIFRASEATTIRLSPDAREATPSLVTVDVEFNPASLDVSPPKIDSATAKMHASTWYSGTPMANFPEQHSISKHYSTSCSMSVETTDDSSWTQQRDVSQRPEGETITEPGCYTRTLQIALTPPTRDKTFLPTFHSCLISRTYKMAISFKINREAVSVEIPVQVQAEAESYAQEEDDLPSFEEALHLV
ncbi:hypothetical protein B0T10DRAFT_493775 [Thelonectria olida]|uniref:Bul1 C-terminal domain-containing protein n=1 Tax=Thelonectria olida TaxID=1576542 RepID=A0A9P8VYF1_9HYPO|nr:hypothetical protein B0T10DRAFT_493775 [Thelonectria olida]